MAAWKLSRWRWALLITVVSDALGFGATLLPPVQWVLDGVTVAALLLVLGFRWQLLAALVVEAVPVLEIFPAWTLVVLAMATRSGGFRRARTPIKRHRPLFVMSLGAWLVILVLAILNGALREGLIVPRLGEQVGRLLSPILLAALVLAAAWFLVPWIRPTTARDAWVVGFTWLGLTLAFEFLAGHYLFGDPWERLLAEYNVARGRLWILVPLTTLLAPLGVHALRSSST